MKTHPLAAFVACAIALVALSSCGSRMCTEIGCGLSLDVRFGGAKSTPGTYQVEVVADGAPSTCQITLPFDCQTPPTCSPSPAPWQLTLSGCAGAPSQTSIDGFFFTTNGPAQIDVVVRRDDVVIGGTTASPSYTVSHPNGPECAPECRQAPALDVDLM